MKDFLGKDAPSLSIRGSLSVARSRIASIVGPDNRLDNQPPWRAKLGASYTLKNAPLKFDLDGNWSPSFLARVGDNHRMAFARRSEQSASASWTFATGQRLIFKVRNLLPTTATQIDEYTLPAETIRLVTEARRYSAVSVQFSTKL
jgi:outer membrane receptor for ferrienterochelin and colicins